MYLRTEYVYPYPVLINPLTRTVAFLNKNFVTTLATSATALLSLSFVFAATCQEVLGSCIFLFVKHPFDIGDRVDISNEALVVERISLLYTVFKKVQNGKTTQIPNIVLNGLWIDNITRSKAMREQLSVFVNFDTTFEDLQLLKSELQNFVLEKENNRDFQPDIDVEVIGIAEMNKMELRVEIKHKSNWSNESIRAARRSKFMCALVLALRKVPIYGPGGGAAVLGSADAPTYSVALPSDIAQANKDAFAATKEGKRMVPTKKAEPAPVNIEPTSVGYSTGINVEVSAVHNLNARNGANDFLRDETWRNRDDISTLDDRPSMDRGDAVSERGLLNREGSRGGHRAPHQTTSPPVPDIPTIPRGPSNNPYAPPPQQGNYGGPTGSGYNAPPQWTGPPRL